MAFERQILVRFPDVDFARVVYYPKFFDYTHQVFEDFFTEQVGCTYARMLEERKVGYPSVHAEADFKAPFRFGDRLRIVLEILRVSTRSVTCRYRVFREGHPTPDATLTVVSAAISMDTFTGVDMPPDVKAAFERHLVS